MVLSEPAAEATIGRRCRALHLPTACRVRPPRGCRGQGTRHRIAPIWPRCSPPRSTKTAAVGPAGPSEARFPRIKRLEDFDLTVAPHINPATLAASGQRSMDRRRRTGGLDRRLRHRQKPSAHRRGRDRLRGRRRVRYVTCAQLVNELAEAADERILSKVVGRYGRLDLLLVDELGYVSVDPRGAELLFQVLTEREERASVAAASNHPFSEWGQTFTDPRLAATVVDRLTFHAHIIETGTDSYRLRAARAKKNTTKTANTPQETPMAAEAWQMRPTAEPVPITLVGRRHSAEALPRSRPRLPRAEGRPRSETKATGRCASTCWRHSSPKLKPSCPTPSPTPSTKTTPGQTSPHSSASPPTPHAAATAGTTEPGACPSTPTDPQHPNESR